MDLTQLQQQFYQKLSSVSDVKELEELRNEFLGRKRGLITALLKELPSVAA